MQKYIVIGKIVNTFGVKGEVKVMPLTDDPKRYDKLDWVYIEENENMKKHEIESVKYNKSFVLIKFKEVSDMTEASRLKELFIKIDRDKAVKLPKNSYFICDLVGCQVIEKNTKVAVGILVEVIETGSNDVYVIKAHDKEILIPALKTVVRSVDIEKRLIEVELPEEYKDDEV